MIKVYKFLTMKFFLILLSGIFIGVFFSWPGIVFLKNWKCFNDIIEKSSRDKISFKAALEVSPSYLIKSKNKSISSKMRIVADACFR